MVSHPTPSQDDQWLVAAGWPTVADQEEISRKIVAAEQADVERQWLERNRLWLVTEAERKRGASIEFDVFAARAATSAAPARFVYRCVRCGNRVERSRRARNGGAVFCSARCKQIVHRRTKRSRVEGDLGAHLR